VTTLPRLAVVYHPTLTRPVAMSAAAASGEWLPVWLVDLSLGDTPAALRMLRRFGDVVDVTGLAAQDAAGALAVHEPAGIVTFSDLQLLWTSQVAESLHLPFFSSSAAIRLVNKGAQRRALRAAGIPTPGFWELPATSDRAARERTIAEVAATASFPVVLKPQESAASRNTFRATNAEELRAASATAAHEQSGLIVEEMLPDNWPRDERPYADYVSVESVLTHGTVSHLMVTGKFPLADPFRETGDFVPSNLPPSMQEVALQVAGDAVNALADGAGVFHTEIKFTPDGPRVIEVNGRVGGMIGEIIDLASESHTLETIANVALGRQVSFDRPIPCVRIAYSADIQAPQNATRLVRLDYLEAIRQLDGVDGVAVHVRPGEALDWRTGTLGHVYSVTGTAQTVDELWSVQRQVTELVVVEYQ
jgi:biotin carboxylase